MFFKRDNVKNSARKVDKVITWLIIWTAVASMIWLSKTNKGKKFSSNIKNQSVEVCKKWYSIFWKLLIWVIKFFNKK